MRKKLFAAFCALSVLCVMAAGASAFDISDINRAVDIIGKLDSLGKKDGGSSPAPAPAQSGGSGTVQTQRYQPDSHTFTFDRLPQNVQELNAEIARMERSPYATAALTIAAYCRYETSPKDCIAMINVLKGPEKMSGADEQFLRERLETAGYVPRSFFDGATPDNSYTPATPYTITVTDNSYSFQEEGYARLFIRSGGADSPRPITLRNKPSTGEWFVWGRPGYLAGIRKPASADPWK